MLYWVMAKHQTFTKVFEMHLGLQWECWVGVITEYLKCTWVYSGSAGWVWSLSVWNAPVFTMGVLGGCDHWVFEMHLGLQWECWVGVITECLKCTGVYNGSAGWVWSLSVWNAPGFTMGVLGGCDHWVFEMHWGLQWECWVGVITECLKCTGVYNGSAGWVWSLSKYTYWAVKVYLLGRSEDCQMIVWHRMLTCYLYVDIL